MQEAEKKKNRIMYAMALVIALGFTILFLWDDKGHKQYDVVVLGDSIMANYAGDKHVTVVLENRLGKSVFNGAFGGTSLSSNNAENWGSVANSEWNMIKLAEAICYRDWKSQKATMTYSDFYCDSSSQAIFFFRERMDTLSKIDFSQVETLIIEHGSNDYNGGVKLDNPQNPYDVTTFGGALRESLRLLQETYPQLRIVLMTPLYCYFGADAPRKCYEVSFGEGGTLDQYVELEKEIAKEFGVECINAYENSGIQEENAAMYIPDGLHLNFDGHVLVGNFLADYFEENDR